MIAAIAAVDLDMRIAVDGKIPWKCKADMQHFRNLTAINAVVMGRKTWEALPVKPLPNRPCFVLTHQKGYEAPGAAGVYRDIHEAIRAAQKESEVVFIAGGADIYAAAAELVTDFFVTVVDSYETGSFNLYLPRRYRDRIWRLESVKYSVLAGDDLNCVMLHLRAGKSVDEGSRATGANWLWHARLLLRSQAAIASESIEPFRVTGLDS